MKTYEVELKRTSYIVVTVKAENEDDAEAKAWAEIEDGRADITDAEWDFQSIEEITNE
jgi:hypothetical protein